MGMGLRRLGPRGLPLLRPALVSGPSEPLLFGCRTVVVACPLLPSPFPSPASLFAAPPVVSLDGASGLHCSRRTGRWASRHGPRHKVQC